MDLEEIKRLMLEKRDAMAALLETADKEKRDLSEDEEKRYNDMDAELDGLDKRFKRAEKLEKRTQEMGTVQRRYTPPVDHSTQPEVTASEQRDLDQYSLTRALRSQLKGHELDGVEREMHEEGLHQQRSAGVANEGGLIVPQIILTRSGTGIESRDMTATGGTDGDQGGAMIKTEVGSIIDALRANLGLAEAGTEMIGGLEGDIVWPKFVEDDQAAEKSENAAANESSPTLTTISTSPKRLPVMVEFSRQLLLQTSPDVEAYLRRYLGQQIATRMDEMGIKGSGSSNEPTGILNVAGIGAVLGGTNGAAPTYENIVDLETAVANANAASGSMSYLTNSKVRGKLKKTFVDTGSNAERVWDRNGGDNPLNNHKAVVSNLVPSDLDKGTAVGICSALLYGNFADSMINQWGGLEFLVNPYSRDTEGLIRLNAWTFYDFLVKRAQSFAAMQDILTT